MKRNFSRFSAVLVFVVLALTTAGLVAAIEGDNSTETTLVGKLSTDDGGGYVLVEAESGDQVALRGEQLADYVDETVAVTGAWAQDAEGHSYFAVSSVQLAG